MNRDTVIGIVGAVILVAAMWGVFQYERTRAPTSLGDNLTLQNVEIANKTGSTVVSAKSEETLNVTQANMTNVTFKLAWRPTGTGPAPAPSWTMKLEVAPPPGVNATGETSATSSSGSAEVTLAIPNAKPTAGPETMGAGEWKVTVTFVSSSTPTIPGSPVTETAQWTLTGTAQAWEPTPPPATTA